MQDIQTIQNIFLSELNDGNKELAITPGTPLNAYMNGLLAACVHTVAAVEGVQNDYAPQTCNPALLDTLAAAYGIDINSSEYISLNERQKRAYIALRASKASHTVEYYRNIVLSRVSDVIDINFYRNGIPGVLSPCVALDGNITKDISDRIYNALDDAAIIGTKQNSAIPAKKVSAIVSLPKGKLRFPVGVSTQTAQNTVSNIINAAFSSLVGFNVTVDFTEVLRRLTVAGYIYTPDCDAADWRKTYVWTQYTNSVTSNPTTCLQNVEIVRR